MENKNALIYGMQRTGTNYTKQLIQKNFTNIAFPSNDISRCLPTHKHFRLQDEKWLAPEMKFYNSFYYHDFKSFKDHVEQLLNQTIDYFFITIKDPYSWYISYRKHAKKNNYIYYRKEFNSQYIIDYNLFYKKWHEFSKQAPRQVIIIRYEDLISDLASTLDNISQQLNLEKASSSYRNLEKVPMSHKFSEKKENYYKNKDYLKNLTKNERYIINSIVDKNMIASLGYQLID